MKPWTIESKTVEGSLIYDDIESLGIGSLCRYKVIVEKGEIEGAENEELTKLFLRVKNKESPLLRPVYLTGPYACYVDVRPYNYDEDHTFDKNEPIQFTSDLRPDEHFKADLWLNENSRMEDGRYSWTIDVISQVSVSSVPKVEYQLKIGTTKAATKHIKKVTKSFKGVVVERWDTRKLWNLPPKFPHKPVHLVILTHGIFANVGCDMLYMKDKIEEKAFTLPEEINPNVVVRGCMDNMGKSARGIRYLGIRVAKYILRTLDELNEDYKVDKLSVIGHSLGGPVQAMAIHYISVKRPDVFDPATGVKPINFIACASPFLGVVGDFPLYVSLALDVGALGLTGRDLTLRHTPLISTDGIVADKDERPLHKFILEALPQSPALEVFQKFVHRTVYANVLHDGIVPLRTAALLYLDWGSLAKVHDIRKKQSLAASDGLNTPIDASSSDDLKSDEKHNAIGEIPIEGMEKKAALQWIMPQVLNKGKKFSKYERTQTRDFDSDSSESDNGSNIKKRLSDNSNFNPPPEASTFMAAISVIVSPVPTQEYLKNPAIRTDAIVHDKVYHPNELPPPHYNDRPFIKKVIYLNESNNRCQERIARAWQEKMSWRKVLVDLKPDSHNNICVRRRFTNLFGNVAVKNLVDSHFGEEACRKYAAL
ncbi:hypothetical protein HG535_0D05270 [Zygotorulaspora mrakii]|uniref:DUF676 domain-containing protein n=1 Tax=Zygotorulaspora mrakii TaxID=42260 RepID=A0A7H9B2D1_ZYGMR|nr:uncharacterized protein HG535_0D05270 [Zygotorulaspora mrakii]QLG72818.1 hypothetical protein HG535_0D05270 [Zygotorulaspora mrakii]